MKALAERPVSPAAALVRRRRGATSPFEPDWLLQRHLHRDVRAALAANGRGRLLDLGCGERPYWENLPRGVRAFGVDVHEPGSRPDVFSVASALPIASGAFDTVLCTQVLEHVPDPDALVAEAARVLSPGGRLILSAPQVWFLHEEPHDYFRFTRFGLVALCRRAGLEPILVRAQGGFFAMAGILLAAHLGSYVRWAAERSAPTPTTDAPQRWRRWIAPLKLPLAAANLAFAMLDALPSPGLFAVNHLVVAEKTASRVAP
jgi:SAM-dependent methyltransferase